MYKVITRKQIREKIIFSPYIYMCNEEDKTSGYVSYGCIIMQISPQKGVRISEIEKRWFD